MLKIRKKTLYLHRALLVACTLGFAVNSMAEPAPGSAYTFRYGAPFAGPIFRLTLWGGNRPRIRFCGERSTFFVGCRMDSASVVQWSQFEQLLNQIQFSQLGPKYASQETDMPTYRLCRERPQKCVRVEEYSDLQENLKHLNETIIRIFGLERWIHGTVEAVRKLEAEHYDFNTRDSRTSIEYEGAYGKQTTMLFRAVEYSNDSAVVDELLKAGADFRLRDGDGCTPLMRAIDLVPVGYTKAATLLRAGSNACDRDSDGETLLSLVRKRKSGLSDDPELRDDKAELERIEQLLIDSGGNQCGTKQ